MNIVNTILGPLVKSTTDNIYICSDLHLNHNKEFLWKARADIANKFCGVKFNNCEEYTDWILKDLYNLALAHISKGEKVYLISLGDNCFNDSESVIFKRLAELPFTQIYSLVGNHSSGLNHIFKFKNISNYKNFTLLGSNLQFKVDKNNYVWLSHFPIMDWDKNSSGVLCGHCHGNNKCLQEDDNSFGQIFDCGVENALRLNKHCYFNLNQCLDILHNKKGFQKNDNQWHQSSKESIS